MNAPAMTIGKIAEKSDVSSQTIRFYERKGLLPPASRSGAGYRLYYDDAVRRIRFIKHAQEIGFSLREIKELLSIRFSGDSTCGDIRTHAEEKIRDVNLKIRKLIKMRNALERLVDQCDGEGAVSECPIIEALEEEEHLVSEAT